MAEVHREFTAHDHLFEVRIHVILRTARPPDLQCHVYRGDVPVVEILAHVRDVVGLRLVAMHYVGFKSSLNELIKNSLRLRSAALIKAAYRRDAPVKLHTIENGVYVGEGKAFCLHAQGGLLDLRRLEFGEKIVQMPPDLRSERACSVFAFGGGELD